MKKLTNKIATITGKNANDPTIQIIAKGWVKFTELGMQQGLSFEEAEKNTYKAFKNDTDNFGTFCTMLLL